MLTPHIHTDDKSATAFFSYLFYLFIFPSLLEANTMIAANPAFYPGLVDQFFSVQTVKGYRHTGILLVSWKEST